MGTEGKMRNHVSGLVDDDGKTIRAGDTLHFGYGIPPVGVDAKVIERKGKLIALTPGHNPPEATVSYICRHFNCWVTPAH